jgi:hypothetical protein
LQLIAGVNVVFQQNRNAVQRAAQLAGLALLIQRVGDAERVGV